MSQKLKKLISCSDLRERIRSPDPYKRLGLAIIAKATDDLVKSHFTVDVLGVKQHLTPKQAELYRRAERERDRCMSFFRSDFYDELAYLVGWNLEADEMIRRCRKTADNNVRHYFEHPRTSYYYDHRLR